MFNASNQEMEQSLWISNRDIKNSDVRNSYVATARFNVTLSKIDWLKR